VFIRVKSFSIIVHLLLGIWILSTTACKKTAQEEDIKTLIQTAMDLANIPSLTACIIKNDGLVWKFASGIANKEEGRRATDETIYLLASISKTVTGAAVMQLYENGLIDLDADISQYLPFQVRHPQYPDAIITTRMVMSHRSGLGWPVNAESSFYVAYFNDSIPAFFPWIREFMLPEGSDYNPSIWKDTAPGEYYWYSNFGVTLLGYLVEVVSGMDFNQYCKEHIFQPLDMPNTSFKISDLNSHQIAMPYQDNTIPRGHVQYIYYPAACLRSSINEFSHFIIAMINGGIYNGNRILTESSVDEMLTRHYPDNEVGLIWKMPEDGWYEHSGSMDGVRTQTEFHKEDKVGILILTNGQSSIVQRRGNGVIYEYIRTEAENYR
jgi:CubicO group peptidase (beta-lactamase class C family)